MRSARNMWAAPDEGIWRRHRILFTGGFALLVLGGVIGIVVAGIVLL
jgi:hypothetical protein